MAKPNELTLFIDFLVSANPNITVGGAGRAYEAHKEYKRQEQYILDERIKKQKAKAKR